MYNATKPYKEEILKLISQTWSTPYLQVTKNIYPIFKRKFSYPEVDHTDGIGTKGIFHWQVCTFKNAVLDALAMNLNDLVLLRAQAYKLQNHLILPCDDQKAILEIIKTLTEECQRRKIAITGGETSIQNNIKGMDISLTVSGFIKDVKPNKFKDGNLIIGIVSNGLHSNGLTKAREILGQSYNNYLNGFVKPTLIYSDLILTLLDKFEIYGMMHITGGAFTKLKDLLNRVDAIIYKNHLLVPQKIFQDLYKRGITDQEMYRTFNCGIGFVLSASKNQAKEIISNINNAGFKADIIGEVKSGKGKIKIESKFSQKKIEY